MSDEIFNSIFNGDLDKVKSLITPQNINTKMQDGFTPLHLAIFYSKVDIVKYLVSQGADTNAQRNDNTSILNTAKFFNNSEIIKCLVDAGSTLDTEEIVDKQKQERYEQEQERYKQEQKRYKQEQKRYEQKRYEQNDMNEYD